MTRKFLPISIFPVAACICGLLFFGPKNAGVAKSDQVLRGNVQEDASLNSSLKVINSATGVAVPRQIPTTGLKRNDATTQNGKTLNGNATSNDPKNKAAATPPPPPVPRTWYAPGHEVYRMPSPVSPSAAAAKDKDTPNTNKNAAAPSTTVPPAPTTKGVTSWRPGYEIKKIAPPAPPSASNKSSVAATKTPGQVAAVYGPPIPTVLVATPLLLPGLKSQSEERALTWEGWYKRIGTAVYSRWQNTEVGPGVATVRVTVTPNDVYSRLVDFTPAEGVERNINTETRFREAAIRAVNNVRSFEYGSPPSNNYKQVVFDVELRRTIDGPVGVHIEPIISPSNDAPKGPIKIETKVQGKMEGNTK